MLEAPKPDQGWSTITAPELLKFDKPGIRAIGVLVAVEKVTINKKSVIEYTLAFDDKRFRFLGTYDLVQKITRAHIGCKFRITYLGENQEVKKGENAMKVFDVQFSGTPTARPDGPITDEDIPF